MQKAADIVELEKSVKWTYGRKNGFDTVENGPDKFAVWLGLASPDLGSSLSLEGGRGRPSEVLSKKVKNGTNWKLPSDLDELLQSE